MPALNYSDSKDKKTENLPSHPDQQNEQSVLSPFSRELSVDEKLELSNAKFKQIIDDFFEGKTITPLSQLKVTPALPTPHVLAQFAFKAYKDYKKRETDAQYETRLELPDGWKLLTTASNGNMTNGYFGAAYWHPEHQQVVIAHRGTDPTNLGALWTDLKGVVRNKYVRQMESASTFADKVVEVLESVNRKRGVIFQLFYTGHSLGGWLAQITTFTTKYLKTKGNVFFKGNDAQDCYHPHTVVFESPGCKNMLLQMTDKFDVRLDGRSIDIENLDITSYLSAPNRINTCNEHVGTVCRIFTDLSDMGWLGKHTALYNLDTHNMQKIVEAFDPDTGQVRKDKQGKLKVHVVIDWPVSSGLGGGEEYESFFKGATHLNDYHQGDTDVTFQIEGYHPMRYQTKPYDERVSRLSVFCQQEQQFLESYLWLRQLPDFFKPKQLFSVVGDNEVQEQVEEILKSFEIKKDKIRRTDGGALQALIPYVKRLLQLFPQVKVSTTRALSSDEVRNRVYQIETKRYIERISQSPLNFKADDLSLRDFVRSDHEQVLQLQMVDGDEWTGLIKVYQVLQETGCLSEGQYTVLKLKRLLTLNQLMDFSKLMQSTATPHLLLMACEDNQLLNDEGQQVIRAIFNTIKHKPNIKIFLSARSQGTTLPSLQQIGMEIFGKAFVARDEQLTWSDITTESQEKLLEQTVHFQGINIALNELITAESPLAKLMPLGAIMEENHLQIGKPVPISNAYNEGYYIGRTLLHHRAIKEEIFIDERKEEFPDLIASTEQKFKQMCKLNPKRNVHWLQKEESGNHLWQQSQGSLETLRKYIDTESPDTYTADDLDKLLEQAQNQRVTLISDIAGMGKSTELTRLSNQIKQNFPAKWVVRIDLNDHTDALKTLEEEEQIDKEKAIEFISEKVLQLKPGLEMELFKQCCEEKQKVRIVIMLDGFDEISPFYKETGIELLQALRQTAVEQLWVTTRPHLRNELEDKLQQLSYTLEPFSEENQIEFLTKFWSLKYRFTKMDNKEKEENNKNLEIFAKELIKKLVQSISDKEREFTGIPLQTRMLAEAFEKELKIFCQSPESRPDLPPKLDLIGLYGKFIDSKYDIYQEEKFQVRKTNVIATEQRKRDLKIMREDHQMLALKVLFNEEQVALFQDNRQCIFSAKELSRIGIVQISPDGKPHFIHRTFAEYFVADFLVNPLTEGNNTSEEVQTFILKNIFLEREYRVIRAFIDGLLSRSNPSEVLQQYGNRIHEIGEHGVKILHQAAGEDNANIIGFLLDSVQAGEHTDTLNELLLKQDDKRQTAWYKAAVMGNMQVLDRLWEWAKKVLTTQELKNELLLATVKFGNTDFFSDTYIKHTALQRAAQEGKTEVFLKLWDWTKEELTPQEIKNEVLLAKDEKERTVWHMAANTGNAELLENLWKWAGEKLTTEELNNKLFLAKDDMEQTAFHIAAEGGKTQALEKIWEWSTEKLTAEEINKLLLAKDEMEETAFHGAARNGKTEVLQKLWEWGIEKLSPEELTSNLLLNKNDRKQTAFHVAANTGQTEVLQKLWEWGKEKLTPQELKNTFLLGELYFQKTVLHVAAHGGNREVVRKLWAWAKEELIPEELKDKFLLANSGELTAFHEAAMHTNIEALHELWECAKGILTKEELHSKLLLAKDEHRRTAWHNAAVEGHTEILETLWEMAKEELTPDELKTNLFLAKDYKERTAWHLAARLGHINALQKLWEWAKEELTTEELHNRILLATDDKEHTAWHQAIERGQTEVLEEIWDCAKKELSPEKLYNELLLAKFDGETTAWHVAANMGNVEILEKLWVWAKEIQTTEELNKNLLLARDKKERTALHVATLWNRIDVLEKLWEFANEETTMAEIVKNLLLATDNFGATAWQVAVIRCDKYLLEQLWDWAKEKLTTDELKHKLFLAKHAWGRTAWHDAAEANNTELLDTLWEWGKEQLTTEELSNKLLLAKDDKQKNAWQLAAMMGNTESLQKIWEWAKAELSTEELNNKFLLAKDDREMTAWHVAADCGNIESLQTIWEWAKQELTTEELKNRLLLAKDDREQTALEVAAEKGNTEVLEILNQWAVAELNPEESNNISCLSTHT